MPEEAHFLSKTELGSTAGVASHHPQLLSIDTAGEVDDDVFELVKGLGSDLHYFVRRLRLATESRHMSQLFGGQWCSVWRDTSQIVPEALRECMLRNVRGSRQGVMQTKQRLRERFWWTHLDRQVRDFLLACEVCSQRDAHVRRARPHSSPSVCLTGHFRGTWST